jgi:hypothetical protein
MKEENKRFNFYYFPKKNKGEREKEKEKEKKNHNTGSWKITICHIFVDENNFINCTWYFK